jgi:hypothetical protein
VNEGNEHPQVKLGDEWIDVIISEHWEAEEGKEFTTLTGKTFKVYSSLEAALRDKP